MASLLERKLIVVTGKGGAGKSTIAAALGLLGARSGLLTLVAEVGEQSHLAAFYNDADHGGRTNSDRVDEALRPATEIELEPGLWSFSLDPDTALIEWMRDLGGRLPARMLASSSSFRYFAAAAPGAEELVSLVKLHDLSAGDARYDLVVLDAPATGHALAMLASPGTFTAIVRSGPLARRAAEVREMLTDASFSAYVAVTRATEMAVSETLELERGLREQTGRDLDAVVVNGTLAGRFTAGELERIDALAGRSDATAAVARAAHATTHRVRAQRRQLARLRSGRAGRTLVNVPFAFTPQVDRDMLAKIAAELERQLIPSRSSRPSSARQSRRTRTDNSR